jgi:hypothetical protein
MPLRAKPTVMWRSRAVDNFRGIKGGTAGPADCRAVAELDRVYPNENIACRNNVRVS